MSNDDTTLYANADGTMSEVKDLGVLNVNGKPCHVQIETVHGTVEQITTVLSDMEAKQ